MASRDQKPRVRQAGASATEREEFAPIRDEIPSDPDEAATVRRATEVLGVEHVAQWLRSRIPSLGGKTPYQLLQTEDGRRQIERVLQMIENGVY